MGVPVCAGHGGFIWCCVARAEDKDGGEDGAGVFHDQMVLQSLMVIAKVSKVCKTVRQLDSERCGSGYASGELTPPPLSFKFDFTYAEEYAEERGAESI